MEHADFIRALGGPRALCELLGYKPEGGLQRVTNWMRRGIPFAVRVERAAVLDMAARAAGLSSGDPDTARRTRAKPAKAKPTTRPSRRASRRTGQ